MKLQLHHLTRTFINPPLFTRGNRLFFNAIQDAFAQAENNGQELNPRSAAQNQAPEMNPETVKRVMEKFGPLVPEKTNDLPDKSVEIREQWYLNLGNYNAVQSRIDDLLKVKKELHDPSFLKNNPNFKQFYRSTYGKLRSTKESFRGLNLKVDWDRLAKLAKGELDSNLRGLDADLEQMINQLVEERAVALEILRRQALEDFKRRAEYLKKQWDENPNLLKYYADAAPRWKSNCDDVVNSAAVIPAFDSKNPSFPEGSKVFGGLTTLWDRLSQMEDSMEVLSKGQDHELSPQVLKERIDALEKTAKEKLKAHGGALISKNEKGATEAAQRMDEMIVRAENQLDDYRRVHHKERKADWVALQKNWESLSLPSKKSKQAILDWSRGMQSFGEHEKSIQKDLGKFEEAVKKLRENKDLSLERTLMSSVLAKGAELLSSSKDKTDKELAAAEAGLENLKASRRNLEQARNLEKQVDDFFNSTERNNEADVFPLGIREQYKWLVEAPLDERARRHAMKRFDELLKGAEQNIKTMDRWVETVYPDITKELGLVQIEIENPRPKIGWRTDWIALKPAWDTIWHVVEGAYEKALKRDQQLASGAAATTLFKPFVNLPKHIRGDVPIVGKISEALSSAAATMPIEKEHAMVEAVSNWAHQYEHASVQHVTHRMHDTKDPYEFRACCEFLGKKGNLRMIDDENFFKQLNYFLRGQMVLPVSKHWHLANRTESEKGLRAALFRLYEDIDLYNNWRQSNTSAIKSEGGKFDPKWSEISEVPGGLTARAQYLLDTHIKEAADPANHGSSTVDSNEFESIINYAVTQGKMDAEDPLYFMIKGIATGILSIERASVFCEHCNDYPASEIFAQSTDRGPKPTIEDIQEWAKMSKDEYIDWYHSHVMYTERVSQRIIKAAGQRKRFDHDYFTAAAAYLSAENVQEVLTSKTDGSLQPTAIQNGAVGLLFGMDTLAESYNQMGDAGREGFVRLMDAITRYDAIVYNRFGKGKDMARLSQSDKNKNPRYAGNYKKYYGRGAMSTHEHFVIMRKYLQELDFFKNPEAQLFHRLFASEGKQLEDADVPALVEAMNREAGEKVLGDISPKSVDELYKSVGAYLQYLVTKRPETVNRFLEAVKKDQKGSVKELRAGAEKKRQEARQEWEQKMAKGEFVEPEHHGHHGHDDHGHGGEHGDDHGGDHGAHHREAPPSAAQEVLNEAIRAQNQGAASEPIQIPVPEVVVPQVPKPEAPRIPRVPKPATKPSPEKPRPQAPVPEVLASNQQARPTAPAPARPVAPNRDSVQRSTIVPQEADRSPRSVRNTLQTPEPRPAMQEPQPLAPFQVPFENPVRPNANEAAQNTPPVSENAEARRNLLEIALLSEANLISQGGPVLIQGRVIGGQAARIEVTWDGSPQPITLHNYEAGSLDFLAQVDLNAGNMKRGLNTYQIVAYDDQGNGSNVLTVTVQA